MFFSSHIIAILAAILFPVFAKAREKARQSSCLSNVKQLCLGVLQYAQDYDECFPRYDGVEIVVYPNGLSGANRWANRIYPYVKNYQVFNCPSATWAWDGGPNAGAVPIGANINLFTAAGTSLGSVVNPSQTAMLGDTQGTSYVFFPTYTLGRGLSPRHNEGANLGFVDGHAKWWKVGMDAATGLPIHPTNAQGVYYLPNGTG